MEEKEFNIEPIICSDIDCTDVDYEETLRSTMLENYNHYLNEMMAKEVKTYIHATSNKKEFSPESLLRTIEEYMDYEEKVVVVDKYIYDELKECLNVEDTNMEDVDINTIFGYEFFI